jgi:hypothetical protein
VPLVLLVPAQLQSTLPLSLSPSRLLLLLLLLSPLLASRLLLLLSVLLLSPQPACVHQ